MRAGILSVLFMAVLGCGSSSTSNDAGAAGDASAQQLCTATGGTVGMSSCCMTASDFPDSCAVGACGCSPDNSKMDSVCTCPANQCFSPGRGCVAR
jgi:hypothetical protein